MKFLNRLKKEFQGWSTIEKNFFSIVLILVLLVSLYMKDSKIALISAMCGISYTFLAGKGKILCYLFGILSTLCYGLISFKSAFWGNFALNVFYYLPMQILGVFKWKNNLDSVTCEIIRTKLNRKNFCFLFLFSAIMIVLMYKIMQIMHGKTPLADSVTTVLSIVGMYLTVKRCIEQWYVWTIVNIFCVIMWIIAYFNGSNCFVTIIMWFIYFCMGIYFLIKWKKDLK